MRASCADKIDQMAQDLADISVVRRAFCAEMRAAGDCSEDGCPFYNECPEECMDGPLDFYEAAAEIYDLVEQWETDRGSEDEYE